MRVHITITGKVTELETSQPGQGTPLHFRVLLPFPNAGGAVMYRTLLPAASGGRSQALVSAFHRKEPRAIYSSRETTRFLNMLTLSSGLPLFWRRWKQPLYIPEWQAGTQTGLDFGLCFGYSLLSFMVMHREEDSCTYRARWDQGIPCSGLAFPSSILSWYPCPKGNKKKFPAAATHLNAASPLFHIEKSPSFLKALLMQSSHHSLQQGSDSP